MGGTVDLTGPTASLAVEEAGIVELSHGATFEVKDATSPCTKDEAVKVVQDEATCPMIVQDKGHDRGVLVETAQSTFCVDQECGQATPSVVSAEHDHSGKTATKYHTNVSNAAPPAVKPAWSRPANGKPGETRPANERPSSQETMGLPAKETGMDDVMKPQVCTYQKGGVCDIHGAGAKLRWKPVGKKVVGQDLKRITWYECKDLSRNGKKLIQSKITLAKKDENRNQGVEDGH